MIIKVTWRRYVWIAKGRWLRLGKVDDWGGKPRVSYGDYDTFLNSYILDDNPYICDVPDSFDEIRHVDHSVDAWGWECFTSEHDGLGNPIGCEAGLVARGFIQEYLIDYDETLDPVARTSNIRIFLSFSNQYYHMDVKTAFLNGHMKGEIYIKVPRGLISETGKVCKFNRAIYGLNPAARCWFEVFSKFWRILVL